MVFQVHLEDILRSHRGIDLNLHKKIVDCVKFHAKVHKLDFATTQMHSREQLIKSITDIYNLEGMKPIMCHVSLANHNMVIVPVFNVKIMLLSLLHDTSRMKKENIAPKYDLFTGKPIDPTIAEIGEIHTGFAWEEARAHHCGNDIHVLPLGLVCFFDATHVDVHGSLKTSPFIGVPAFFNEDCRYNVDFWTVFGYIPNTSYGKSKANRQSSTERLQEKHDCLREVMKQFLKLDEDGGFWTEVMGRRVRVVVWIHIVTGDTDGHNELVGQFNANGNTACAHRHCYCPPEDLASSKMICKLRTKNDVDDHKAAGTLQSISMHPIDNAFDGVPLGGDEYGIMGRVPSEMLHVSGNGIIKYELRALNQLIGRGDSKQKEKESFDTLHQMLLVDAGRQSERDFPRMSLRNGALDGTKLTATERIGILFILLCVTYTATGVELLKPGWNNNNITAKEFRNCIKLQLGFEKWVDRTNSRVQVIHAEPLLESLIDAIKHCFPREEGNGWGLPKIHSLGCMLYYMMKFGKAKNFSGQMGERALKKVVKDPAENTKHRANKLDEQCAQRVFETEALEWAYEDIKPWL